MDNKTEQQYKERIEHYQEQLRQLANELTIAEERERREIASDLHDHIGQALAVINNKLSELHSNAAFSGFEHNIDTIRKLVRQTIAYTRNLTAEISPPVLYELGLEPALNSLAGNISEKAVISVTVESTGVNVRPSDETAVMLYKSVRELLRNSEKHGEAKYVFVKLDYSEDRLNIRVEDNGKGFDTSILDPVNRKECGFGLFSVKERIQYLGGEFRVNSSPGSGTEIELAVPLKRRES